MIHRVSEMLKGVGKLIFRDLENIIYLVFLKIQSQSISSDPYKHAINQVIQLDVYRFDCISCKNYISISV